MELDIDFEEIMTAFEESRVEQHYFIDTEKNETVFISEWIELDVEEKLKAMDSDRFIKFPPRLPRDDYLLMELFVYDIEPFELAEEFHKAIRRPRPFRNFKDILYEHPRLEKKWFAFKEAQLRNECINWLVNMGITLKDQKLIPDIEVRELEADEFDKIPSDFRDFCPMACMKCGRKEGIIGRVFEINVAPDNLLVQRETEKIMEERFGVKHFGNCVGPQNFLTAAKCPQCGSDEIFWDF